MEQEVQNVEVQNTTTENVETATTEEKAVKTFTQDEVNDIIKTRLRNMPSDDELKSFNEWKESQKSQEEKYNEVLKENETLKAQIKEEANKSVVANAGVLSEFQKFVISEVSQMDGEFSDNLNKYLEENKQYLKKEEPKTTGFSQNTTNLRISEEKSYLDNKYKNNPYYKN